MLDPNTEKKVADILQIMVATPDGRVLLRKEKKKEDKTLLDVYSEDYYKWDMTLWCTCSNDPQKSIVRSVKSFLGVNVDANSVDYLGDLISGKGKTTAAFIVNAGSVMRVIHPSESRNIISVPFEDVLEVGENNQNVLTKTTILLLNLLFYTK